MTSATCSRATRERRDVIPESADTLESVNLVGGKLVALYLRDVCAAVKVFDSDGRFVRDIALPGLGSASGFGGHEDDPETFFVYTDFITPSTIYRHDLASVLRVPGTLNRKTTPAPTVRISSASHAIHAATGK